MPAMNRFAIEYGKGLNVRELQLRNHFYRSSHNGGQRAMLTFLACLAHLRLKP